MKLAAANSLCLGGVLIWAVDLDGSGHASSNDLLGIGAANGVSAEEAEEYREQQETLLRAASIQNSCYWSFCGQSCKQGYSTEAWSNGQVPGLEGDLACTNDETRTLCCAPGTNPGTCSWHGWRGVGLACASDYCPEGTERVAVNSNSYKGANNLTCNGGSQSYCCSGFVPSPYSNTDSLYLLGQDWEEKEGQNALAGRADAGPTITLSGPCLIASAIGFGLTAEFKGVGAAITRWFLPLVCIRSIKKPPVQPNKPKSPLEGSIAQRLGQGALGPKEFHEPTVTYSITWDPTSTAVAGNGWPVKKYKKDDPDCETTYTCRYGRGFDEICDNQRWAIDKAFNGRTVFNKIDGATEFPGTDPAENADGDTTTSSTTRRGRRPTYKDRWNYQRAKYYRTAAQESEDEDRNRCDL
ncbi:hypothetical protein ASPCAL10080 [Aspergillus calidoustus]|uniref:Uncharacterized protein n=1 Tax=Aspergillus calidoustus TaxID=454130 RepID=A0A0U5G5A3_ASPCI|nr:hypothetical protein ASPCAL10080 [Aspergillus calidoustus]